MAEQALKKLEDQLKCPICLDTYTDPKQLICNHVYCQQCLSKLVVQDKKNRGQQVDLTCPNCRQITPVPASGVAGLQAAFQINQFLEIVEKHKMAKHATSSVENMESSASASTSHSPHGNVTVTCPQHDGMEVVLYCETCAETICFKCIMKDEKHHSHNYEELNTAFEKYKEEIASSLDPMENQLVTIKTALAQLDARCEEISNQQAAMEANIHDTIRQLHKMLDVRKTELIGQLHQLTQAKLKSLAAQKDQIETTQAQLGSCLHFMKENSMSATQRESLMINSITVRQVKELTTAFQADILEPNAQADMTFSAPVDITAVIQNYGQVHNKGSPDPLKCTATGKGMEVAVVWEKSTALLQTLGFNNQPSNEASNSIMCELVSERTGTRVGGSVERRGQNKYQISYQPTIKGRHQLHIKVEGQHIKGSPFSVAARLPVEKFGTPSVTIGGVWGPEGVAVNHRGEVVVAERGGYCVSVFSPSGEKLRSFGIQGFGQGQFDEPFGVAVDGKGYILVTNINNHCIQKFTMDGEFLTAVGTEGSGPLQFSHPRGIAFNASNDQVYVADGNCRIQILNSDLSYIGVFGQKGSRKGQFNNPQHLACDSSGNVYVADCNNHRIQVFTAEGKLLRMFGGGSFVRRNLEEPSGIAVDSSDRVYVGELGNSCVSVFTSKGQFVTSFSSKGSAAGLAVDNELVHVCDCYNSCVQIF